MMDEDFCLLTSLRLQSRRCSLLPFHLDRLVANAEALDFALDRRALGQAIERVAAEYHRKSPAQLRVTVIRDGSWQFEDPRPLAQISSPLFAMLWPDRVKLDDPLLPFSTTHRPIYNDALRRARRLGLIDFIFQNEDGMVTEGADHSIFVRHGSRWQTPTLRAGLLPGVFRRHLLGTMANVVEEDFTRDQLFDADEIWLTNAVYGYRSVHVIPE